MANTPSFLCGFDMGTTHEAQAVSGGPGVSVTATGARTGQALRCNSSASSDFVRFLIKISGGTFRALFQSFRFWFKVVVLPGVTDNILMASDAVVTDFTRLTLNPTGTLTVSPNGGVSPATSTLALAADGLYHLIEVDAGWNAGAGARVFVDGVQWASTGAGLAGAGSQLDIGSITATTDELFFDDLICFSDSLNGVLWGDVRLLLLPAVSDNARGNWTGGAGGTTNLFQAINGNAVTGIPEGLTAGSDTDTSQIQNAVSATYPATAAQRGDFNCQSYDSAGIRNGDVVHAVQAVCQHGEGIATGTKPGGLFIVSNPAQASPGITFDYGDDLGAIGTFPTNWAPAAGPVTVDPALALATRPVVGVHKNVASTRESHVAFAGIYVAYTPGLPPELMGRPDGLHGQQQMHQVLSQ